ncbi:signal transduction histidine kinase/ligand-binding sensor domain-containing protein/DNA-binding response OmpR family regulator [Parabacteroides sp. PF5-6]|nr:signal transduction histidine kinase/ligand-binding sensor domain-containing protein/DNA-binding response OmpR family regulator [Parabacteroides sp. PF5-6]
MITQRTLILCLFCFLLSISCAQTDNREMVIETDHRIATTISNQQITSFAEDCFGNIWIGTFRGLNKYNGYEFHQYFNSSDSTSLSDNQIRGLLSDSKGQLWVCTVYGVCRYTHQDSFERIKAEVSREYAYQILENHEERIFVNFGMEMGVYLPEENKFVSATPELADKNLFIRGCFIDSKNNLWIVTSSTVFCYNSTTLALKASFDRSGQDTHYAFMRDNDELWLASLNTLSILDTRSGKYIENPDGIRRHPKLSGALIQYMHQASSDVLFINTNEGMFVYDIRNDKAIHQDDFGLPLNTPNAKITTMFTDSQKNLWIGGFDQGFTVQHNAKERFNNNYYLSSHTQHRSITSIQKDKENNLWMTTSRDGVYVYDTLAESIHAVETRQFFPEKDVLRNDLSSVFIDSNNDIWLIAQAKLIRCRYDKTTRALYQKEVHWMPVDVAEITEDRNGTIWAGTRNRCIYGLRRGSEAFEELQLHSFSAVYSFINAITTLSTGEILVASYPHNPQFIDPDTWNITEAFDVYPYLQNRPTFIPTCLYEDSKGDIWIGTIANEILHHSRSTNTTECILGASCTDISSIIEDTQGNMWISTLYGLSKYDQALNKFTNYYIVDGIGGNQFNEHSVCRLDNGMLLFGGTHGLTFFNPIDVISKRSVPLLFEDLKIHNQLIRPFRSACIDKHLNYAPVIRLNHNESSFTVSFTALDYSEFERVHYHYIMEGYDKFWIDARNNREAYYSNLPAGKYTFKVRITNNDESILEAENSISIIVRPAPWATGWAYALYTLIILAICYVILRLYNRNRLSKLRIAQSELEKEQERRLNQMNMSFFANVSHEFRTPLTMISGPVTQLCNTSDITGDNKQLLLIVQRSVNRMLKLVNQLMDFNKLENDTLRLAVKRTDVISELNRLIEVFRISCNNKGVALKTYGLEDSFVTWLDTDKLDKINTNLISNALKFTEKGGKITIRFDVICRAEALKLFALTDQDMNSEYIQISVTDTGCGIPEDKLEKIFERYYQLNEQMKGSYNWGTGIGLYFTRCLVNLHHGYIKAGNNEEGGAVFTYILPTNDALYPKQERLTDKETQEEIYPIQTEVQWSSEDETKEAKEKQHSVLVVDDDTEVVHYLKTLLSPYYKVTCRFDAESAYKTLKEEAADIVLSDVVMPGLGGYQLCRMIKEDIQLSHIPVILVTAKITVESQVEGLDTGADAYVTKPFDPTYLLALIKSQLKNREKIQNLLVKTTQTEKIEENVLSPQDNVFMKELYSLMENELSNPELNITRMTEVMKISRTKFYYKVKGLTGENPNVFFKTYKLNRAAELLKEGKHNVSEIADMTGFSTLPHFSSSFKKQFGVSPSEYHA